MKNIIRAVRVLEYIGPEEWVKTTLKKSYVQKDSPFISFPRSIREISLTLTKEEAVGSAQELNERLKAGDEEIEGYNEL